MGREGTFKECPARWGWASVLPSAGTVYVYHEDYSGGLLGAPPLICKWPVLVEGSLGVNSAFALPSSVALNKFLNLSVPQCPCLSVGFIIGPALKGSCKDEMNV